MSERVSPHQRAEQIVHGWYCDEDEIPRVAEVEINDITRALQQQSNADEERHREKQAALRTLLAEALAAKDAAEAHAAEMRRALEPFARWAQQLDAPPNWVPDGCPILASPGDISDFSVVQLRAARAALAISPGEALERIKRKAVAEAAKIIRRGIKAMEREVWDAGETDQEWLTAARQYLSIRKLEQKIEAESRAAELRKGGK